MTNLDAGAHIVEPALAPAVDQEDEADWQVIPQAVNQIDPMDEQHFNDNRVEALIEGPVLPGQLLCCHVALGSHLTIHTLCSKCQSEESHQTFLFEMQDQVA